jgi:hypothetical protein
MIHPCLFCKLFALGLAAILKAYLGILWEEKNKQKYLLELCKVKTSPVQWHLIACWSGLWEQVEMGEQEIFHPPWVDSEMQCNLEKT